MPTFKEKRGGGKTKTQLDEAQLLTVLKSVVIQPNGSVVYVEKQQPMQKQGLVSTFGLGVQYGMIRGMLRALGGRYYTMRSQDWQAEFSIVRSKDTKHCSYQQASSLFPNAKLQTERGRILDGHCDALLMAEFMRRKYK